MSKKKKTYSVSTLTDKVNRMILHSPDRHKDGRESLQVMIESVLMETGNYKGFCYLTANDMRTSENGMSVGVKHDGNGNPHFDNTDHTRVYYYR